MGAYAFQPGRGYTEVGAFEWIGHLSIKADASIDLTKSWGKGATWSKTGVGTYQLQLDRRFQGAKANAGVTHVDAIKLAAANLWFEIVSADFVAGTYTFRTANGTGAAADPTAVIEADVNVTVLDSSVPFG